MDMKKIGFAFCGVFIVLMTACSNKSNITTGENVTTEIVTDKIEIEEYEAVASTEVSTTTEETTAKVAESSAIMENVEISVDWTDLEFAFNGESLKVPMSYQDFKERTGFSFNLSDYGYDDGYVLNAGDKVYATIDVINPIYGDGKIGTFKATIGLENIGENAIDIMDGDIWSFNADISHVKSEYPDIRLSQGITWGSTKDDIINAYGEPNDTYNADSYDVLTYEQYDKTERATIKMKLYVYNDDSGLMSFQYQKYR